MIIGGTPNAMASTAKPSVLVAAGVPIVVSVTLGAMRSLGHGISAFRAHIAEVVTKSPEKEMLGIHALPIVALMQNAQFGAGDTAGKLPGYLVRLPWFSQEAELSVSVGVQSSRPVPAPSRLVNLVPEPRFDIHKEIIA